MDPLQGWPFILECDVRWGDMDAYAHVNNTVYFRYFEDVRIQLLTATKLDRSDGPIGGILADTRCRFKAPVTFPDRVRVGGAVSEIRDDRFRMAYRLVSTRLGRVAAEGDGLIVGYDYDKLAKAPLPAYAREVLERSRVPGESA